MEAFGYLIGVFWLLMLIIAAIAWVCDFIHKHFREKPQEKKDISITDFKYTKRNN